LSLGTTHPDALYRSVPSSSIIVLEEGRSSRMQTATEHVAHFMPEADSGIRLEWQGVTDLREVAAPRWWEAAFNDRGKVFPSHHSLESRGKALAG
jgi:hypothetical protein